MSTENSDMFSDDEKDILQEVMNIAFGSATADLAEVIDIFVVLNVPQIQIIRVKALPEFINNAMNTDSNSSVSIVDQKFWGDFNGSGFLVFPANAGKQLISIFEGEEPESGDEKAMEAVENSVLMEIGNILIGACVGKVSELLKTVVTYSPPEVVIGNSDEYKYLLDSFDPNQTAIIMKTIFEFEKKNVSGFLLLLTNQESIAWLRKSLNDFMESFE